MPKRDSKTVEMYLQELSAERRSALEAVRSLIKEAVPDSVESMRYGMLTFELGEVVCSMASQKHYMSLYMDTSIVDKYREELGKLSVGKSCIRFKKIEALPLETVRKILLDTVQAQSAKG